MWTLEEGVGVVRALQKACREYNYHLTIGGGVVNKGTSEKDLDLYFLPMGGFDRSKGEVKPDGLLMLLSSIWGDPEPLQKYANEDVSTFCYAHAVKFMRNGKRIDCFIF